MATNRGHTHTVTHTRPPTHVVTENDTLSLASGAPTVIQDKQVASPVYSLKKQHTLPTTHAPTHHARLRLPHSPGAPLRSPPPQPHNGPAFCPLPAQTTTPGVPPGCAGGDPGPSADYNPGGRERRVRAVELGTRDLLSAVVLASARAPVGRQGAFWELWSRRAGAPAGPRGAFWESWSRRAGASERAPGSGRRRAGQVGLGAVRWARGRRGALQAPKPPAPAAACARRAGATLGRGRAARLAGRLTDAPAGCRTP